MKICFSTLGCPEWSFSEIVSVASDLGYNGIEIRGIQNELYVPAMEPFSAARKVVVLISGSISIFLVTRLLLI